jgi:xanthine dehydrogenase accessory factor
VGHAIVQALLPLPFHVQWCDSRQEIFPALSHERLQMESFDDITACVPTLATNCALLIMSFTHAEDLDVLRAALQRNRQSPGSFNWIGLIGSKTKWSRFQNRLMERGISQAELDQVVCPIGLPGISGKSPAVIAASVAAQLLLIPPQVSTASAPG